MTDRKCIHMTAEMARNCHVCNSHQMPADAIEEEQCAVVKPLEWVERRNDTLEAGQYQVCYTRGEFWRVRFNGRVVCKDIKGVERAIAWANRHNSDRILSSITIRPASEVAAEAKAEAIEEAKSAVGAMLPENGAGEPQDATDKLIDATRRSCISEIDALHTDATRAAFHAAIRQARNDALREAAEVLDRYDGAPCRPTEGNSWSDDEVEMYHVGQMDASVSWKAAILAMIDKETDA